MWSLKEKQNGDLFLTYDRSRHLNPFFRGIWEFVGPQDNAYTATAVRINQNAGHICCPDDEGNVRVLVLEE